MWLFLRASKNRIIESIFLWKREFLCKTLLVVIFIIFRKDKFIPPTIRDRNSVSFCFICFIFLMPVKAICCNNVGVARTKSTPTYYVMTTSKHQLLSEKVYHSLDWQLIFPKPQND